MVETAKRAPRRRRRIRRRGVPGPTGSAPAQAFPPGHFYSPVPDSAALLAAPERERLWPEAVTDPAGIDLRGEEQLRLLQQLAQYPLPDATTWARSPWDTDNDQFPLQDAATLYALVRHLEPRRVIEIGSGWSTLVTARAVADAALETEVTCIEPYPRAWLRELDAIALREERVEHAPFALFEALRANDVLFIDSSHVAKTGSDVVHEFLHILPRLADGVVVHVHDIFIPEDYPRPWVAAGFGWNEQYLLQAWLTGNTRARILTANHWLSLRHPEAVRAAFGDLPLEGSSFWFTLDAVA